MKRVFQFAIVGVLAAEALIIGQGSDVNKLLADIREALGGEQKLAAVKTLTATGRSTRVTANGSVPNDFEMAMELPGKFMKKEVIAMMMGNVIARTSGFNGDSLIEAIDAPPEMFGGGGHMTVRSAGGATTFGGPGGAATPPSPAEQADATRRNVISAKQEFARLTLGMFATSFSAYPLRFTSGGQAESPEGTADIIDVKGEGDFAVRLFVNSKTHMPLMLSWMAREPLTMNISPGGTRIGGPGGAPAGGAQVMTFGGAAGQGGSLTPEEREKLMQDMEARRKEAEAKARTVEYRYYYGDYQKVDGVNVPMRIQRAIDGKPSDELTFEKVKINSKIDPQKFAIK